MERQPVQFLSRDLPALLKDAREVVGAFVGAQAGAGAGREPSLTLGLRMA